MEVYDPKVDSEQVIADLISVIPNPELVQRAVSIKHDAYEAVTGAHAIVICTEWDEFEVYIHWILF